MDAEVQQLMCGYVRYIAAAWLAGLAVTSVTGSDLWGAVAALAAAGATALATRLFPALGGGASCALPQRDPGASVAREAEPAVSPPSATTPAPVE